MSLNYYQIIHLYQRFVILQILSHLHCRKEVTSMDNPLILIENGCDDLHLGSKVCVEEPQDLLNSVRSALCTGITNSEVIGKKVADDLEEQPSDTKRGQMS
ncbi:uncharacterized protein LOC142320492 isoform X3 [Lycorma delicatula]|uniref:uncharacterized protein LOC142320492 isoform X3 n=1 Tax=Lycorma delicatula TaxID=130591 RepID=UPI003F511D66